MSENYTFLDLAKDVFNNAKKPLTANEIWEKAVELELDNKKSSNGKTPWVFLTW